MLSHDDSPSPPRSALIDVVGLGRAATIEQLSEGVAVATGAPVRVRMTNPVTTDELVAILLGGPAPVGRLSVKEIDDYLGTWGYSPHVESPRVPASDTVGGLATLLDQLSASAGLGGQQSTLVRDYLHEPSVGEPERGVEHALIGGIGGDSDVHQPFLSILVRTQGAARRLQTLRDTLLCLHAQSDDDLEILVLAHRTSPPVLAAVTEVAKEPAASRIVTRVIDVRAPGRSASLIAGLHAARGLYVAALDDDDTVLAHWVETFRGLAEQSARPAVLRCRAVSQPMELLHDPSVGFRASNAWASPWKAQFSLSLHWLDSQSPIHVCAYPREEMLRWGLTWDPSLQVVEDWDLLARAASRLGVPGHQVGDSRLIGGRPPSALWRL